MKPLRILSIGAGAIGTYIGGSLVLAGHEVVFLEHPKVAKQLHALKLNMNGEEYTIDAPTLATSLEDALATGSFDAALFALKSFDAKSAMESFAPYAEQLPPFLCLSNGVDNEPTIAAALGEDKVIYGTVTTAVGKRGLGNIIVEKLRGVGVAKGHAISERLAGALNDAGVNCQLYERALDMKWSKMLTNLIANPTSAILNMTAGDVFSHNGLFRLEIAQLREALAVMKAQGIKVVDLPGTPVRALAWGTRLPYFLSQPLMQNAVGKGRGDKMPSFHIDLHGGRGMSEIDFLHGAVVRAGEQYGIPTPVNTMLTETLLSLATGDLAIDAFEGQPEKLLGEL